MKQLFTTNGRVPRSTYWLFNICFFVVFAAIGALIENTQLPGWAETAVVLSVFPILLLGIIVQIKRWHDRDKSGAWILINLVPIIGGIWALIECGFMKGTVGANRFGADPLAQNPPPIPRTETAVR